MPETNDEFGFETLEMDDADVIIAMARGFAEIEQEKERRRTVFVLAPPRFRASLVAGILHKLGVNMGSGFLQPRDALAPRGYFEDRRWQTLNRAMTGQHSYDTDRPHEEELPAYFVQQYGGLIEVMNARHRVWGVKDPRLCFMLDMVLPVFPEGQDVRVVSPIFDYEQAAQDLKQHSLVAYGGERKLNIQQARKMIEKWVYWMDTQLAWFDGPKHNVDVECLESDAVAKEITMLVEFCFEDMEQPSEKVIDRVIYWTSGIDDESLLTADPDRR